MATRTRNIVISSPGRIPNYAVGLDIPSGDTIELAGTTVVSTIPSYLTAANITKNTAIQEIDGVEYAIGHVLIFDLVCLVDAPEFDEDDPQYIQIDYNTTLADEQRLRYRKEIEVYEFIDLE